MSRYVHKLYILYFYADTNRLDLVEEKSLLSMLPKFFRKSVESIVLISSLTENPVVTRKILLNLDSKEYTNVLHHQKIYLLLFSLCLWYCFRLLEQLLKVVEDKNFGTTCLVLVFNAIHNLVLEEKCIFPFVICIGSGYNTVQLYCTIFDREFLNDFFIL